MNLKRLSHILAVTALVAAAPVASAGSVLTSKTGMTLYTFDKDAPGKSNCHDSCLAVWPAVPAEHAPSDARDFGTIERPDGTRQLTHKNRPVYYYVQDKKPGDTMGDGIGGVWHVIPAGAAAASKPAREARSYGGGYSTY